MRALLALAALVAVALLAAALLLIKPGYVTDALGLGLLALVVVAQKAARGPPRTKQA